MQTIDGGVVPDYVVVLGIQRWFFLPAITYKVVYLSLKVFSFFWPRKHADGLWFIFCHGISRKMFSFLFLDADKVFDRDRIIRIL